VILPESCVGANPTMPITVAEAFVAAGLSPGGSVTWGTKPTTLGNGVYIVSLNGVSRFARWSPPACPVVIHSPAVRGQRAKRRLRAGD
jgi:hypothetical protein